MSGNGSYSPKGTRWILSWTKTRCPCASVRIALLYGTNRPGGTLSERSPGAFHSTTPARKGWPKCSARLEASFANCESSNENGAGASGQTNKSGCSALGARLIFETSSSCCTFFANQSDGYSGTSGKLSCTARAKCCDRACGTSRGPTSVATARTAVAIPAIPTRCFNSILFDATAQASSALNPAARNDKP